jgi:hypothetical protein
MKKIPILVERGIVKINEDYAFIVKKSKDIIALTIYLDSKYCEVIAHGDGDIEKCESIFLDKTKDSLYLDNRYKKITTITFKTLKGFSIHSYTIWKYCLNVCLVKRRLK